MRAHHPALCCSHSVPIAAQITASAPVNAARPAGSGAGSTRGAERCANPLSSYGRRLRRITLNCLARMSRQSAAGRAVILSAFFIQHLEQPLKLRAHLVRQGRQWPRAPSPSAGTRGGSSRAAGSGSFPSRAPPPTASRANQPPTPTPAGQKVDKVLVQDGCSVALLLFLAWLSAGALGRRRFSQPPDLHHIPRAQTAAKGRSSRAATAPRRAPHADQHDVRAFGGTASTRAGCTRRIRAPISGFAFSAANGAARTASRAASRMLTTTNAANQRSAVISAAPARSSTPGQRRRARVWSLTSIAEAAVILALVVLIPPWSPGKAPPRACPAWW